MPSAIFTANFSALFHTTNSLKASYIFSPPVLSFLPCVLCDLCEMLIFYLACSIEIVGNTSFSALSFFLRSQVSALSPSLSALSFELSFLSHFPHQPGPEDIQVHDPEVKCHQASDNTQDQRDEDRDPLSLFPLKIFRCLNDRNAPQHRE